jgi:hypothetical protein
VGNGDSELNHPNVYRALIEDMGIEMPAFDTPAFCRWERLRDEAFRVPCFWLAVSQFPRRFMPETLGLNLAMELSGVGGAYRTARDQLRHYGFSTLFVDLHNTIDNVSTGHSARAVEAIERYMDDILATHRRDLIQAHWKRVWTGYRALVPPTGTLNAFLARMARDLNISVSAAA